MVSIVNYGLGNLASLENAFAYLGHRAELVTTPAQIAAATRLVLPGVGSFDWGMRRLAETGLAPALHRAVLESEVPVLGICLGLQLFAKGSEEGKLPGLGWIDAKVVRFQPAPSAAPIKVPHMGWNTVRVTAATPLFNGLETDNRFYFVHSYHLADAGAVAVGVTSHGGEFVSAVQKGHIFGVQFHPEKSHRFGMQLLRNFLAEGRA